MNRSKKPKAIDRCNQEGGGKVIVPPGVYYLNGPIHLKSNVHLYLSEGARLEFSQKPEDYLPLVLTRWEGTELFNYSPFIYAYQATNVAITG
ncbi:MAG: glycoside hydrolase family 28 protein, partial [Calditrichaeota bacterium]|nr:glycoside hydrolase family 28 protein [Calditrichota bacterium]